MSACIELVSGVSQLAQNTALGMAAICSNGAVPLAESRALAFAPNSTQLIAITALRNGDHPVLAARGTRKPHRAFAPNAAADFAAFELHRKRAALTASSPFSSAGNNTMTAADRGNQRAREPIQDWGIYRAPPQPPSRIASDKLVESGGRMSGGYVFFYDVSDDAAPGAAEETSNGARSARAEADKVPAGGEDQAAISGGVATDVNGDNIDLLTPDYGLTPDVLLSRGGIMLSGGYSSVEGMSIGGRIVRQNIGGRDREVAASARYSKVRQSLEVGYADRNFLGSSLSFAPTLFAHQTSAKGFGNGLRSTPFAQSSYGIGVQFSRKFESRLSVTANYRLSFDEFRMRGKSKTCDASFFGSSLCNELGSNTNSLLSVALAFDRRDKTGSVTRGFRLRLAQDIGLGGSAPYSKTRLGGELHIGLGKNWTLLIDAEGGYLAPIGNGAIPLFDRFYAGDTGLRGFDLRGVGPKVRPAGAVAGHNVAIGGRVYYAGRAEVSGSVGGFFEKFGLQPSLFVDAGSVFGASRDRLLPGETLIGNCAKPRISAGLGLSMKTPAGTLRFDIAQPLVKQPGDQVKKFSLSFVAAI